MTTPPPGAAEVVVPVHDGERKVATEQQIDPWNVEAGHDAQGNAIAIDYVALSQ